MKHFLMGTRRRVAALVVFLAVLASSAALAAWLSSTNVGTNQGAGAFGSLPSFTLSVNTSYTGTSAGKLMPGAAGSVMATITNPSSTTYKLTGWQAQNPGAAIGPGTAVTTTGATPSACASAVTFNFPGLSDNGSGVAQDSATSTASPVTLGTPVNIPPGTTTVEIPAMLYASTGTPSTCQTGTVEVSSGNIALDFSN